MANPTTAGALSLKWIYGWNSTTVQFITNNVICYVCGNHIAFVKYESKQTENIFTSPGLGIVEFTANKLDSVFAFGEICVNPRIFIYNYPRLEKVCELLDGAELEIKSIYFSWDTHLLCFSGLPDYKITIWKWTEALKLCSVAVNQHYHHFISFNPCNWRNICTMQKESVILWDIYHYNKEFVLVSKTISLPQSSQKTSQSFTQESYKGLTLPEIELDPPNKYQLKNILSKSPGTELTGHCWLPNGDILVSTNTGEIWKVDGEKLSITLFWGNKTKSTTLVTDVSILRINSLVYHQSGLYIGSEEGAIMKFRVLGKSLKLIAYCKLDSCIIKLQFSPNFSTLLISCADGNILSCEAALDTITPVALFTQMYKVVAASMLPPWTKYILVLLEDGTVKTLSQDTKEVTSILNIPSNCISMTCSPLWCGAILGTDDGKIYIVEHCKYTYPRVIHTTALDKNPIKMIKFDNSGYLVALVCTPKIYFMSGRPSADFVVFGYVDLRHEVRNICSWEFSKTGDVHFIFVYKDKQDSITQFTRVQINKNITSAQAERFVDMEGKFSDSSVSKRTWISNTSCMGLATENSENMWYTFVSSHKHFMKFGFPEFLKPYDYVTKDHIKVQIFGFLKSFHELSEVHMASNLTYQQIITIGNDGKLICRYAVNMDSFSVTDADFFVEKDFNCKLILPRSGCNILVITNEGYLLLYNWANPTAESPLSIRKKSHPYRELPDFGRENMLSKLKPAYQIGTALNTEATLQLTTQLLEQKLMFPSSSSRIDNLRGVIKDSYSPLEILEQWPDFEISWAENRKRLKYESDLENSKQQISEMQKTVKRLGFRVAKLLVENDLLPESEQISRQEFDLDRERQGTLNESNKTHLNSIRYSTARRNLKSNFMWNKIKKECWDAMEVKGAAVNAFHANMQVFNFPLRARTEAESELLDKILRKRMIEVNNYKLLVKLGFQEPVKWRAFQKEIDMVKTRQDESEAVDINNRIIHMGSQSVMFGVDNPYLHSQFELYTRDQKRTQIVILQDSVRKLKLQFNKFFGDVIIKKQSVFQKIKEKNIRMKQIVDDIRLPTQLWTPEWSTDEKPEKCLVVVDSEIKSQRFYTPEQKILMEKKRVEEDEIRKKKIADDFRFRAIGKMMGGVLQSRREDEIFKKRELINFSGALLAQESLNLALCLGDVSLPPILYKKPPEQYNPEEKIIYEAYLKKVKELNEEREKLKKQLEAEFNRNNEIVQELASVFDEEVKDLSVKKFKAQMLVLQEELKIVRLNLSMAFEEELNDQQTKLMRHVTRLKNKRTLIQSKITEIQKSVQVVQEEYDILVIDERQVERILRKELGDLPLVLYEGLVKLFRKKPRVQRLANTNPCQQASAGGGNPYGEGPFGRELVEITNTNFINALNELDDAVNMPDGVLPNQWTQFCKLRKQKMDLENQIKQKALIIADMIAYLQSKQVESDNYNKDISETNEMIVKLIQDKNTVLSNLDIQIVLKLGQMELDNVDGFLPDYGGALLIHRSLVEERNKQIRALGATKQQSILESTKLHNMIELREWEHRSKEMMVEDLVNSAKEIQKMQVTREIKNFLRSKSRTGKHHALQMVQLEDTLKLMTKLHEKCRKDEEKRQERAQKIKQYIKLKNAYYDNKLEKINNVLSRWKLIPKAEEDDSHIPQKQFDEVVHWRSLVRKAAEQSVTILELRKQMNVIWERSIPMLAVKEIGKNKTFF